MKQVFDKKMGGKSKIAKDIVNAICKRENTHSEKYSYGDSRERE